jgi:hypothetical protein
MFCTAEGEVEELETLLQIYRNKIVETVELENDALNNGRVYESRKSKNWAYFQCATENSFQEVLVSLDEIYAAVESSIINETSIPPSENLPTSYLKSYQVKLNLFV